MTGSGDLARLALALVDIPSESRQERQITDFVAAEVARHQHIEVWFRSPDAIIFGPRGETGVVLAGHSDTVPAQGNLPGRLESGVVHGLGSADMKGALAVMLALAAELGELPVADGRNPLFVIFGREELALSESVLAGLFQSCPRIQEGALAVVMEPTANRVQAGCLGNIQAEVEFSGVAAHSARPWLGRNAVHEALRGLRHLADLRLESVVIDGLEFREVLSVTQIAGGLANNVIPDRCVAGLNYRYAGNRSPTDAEARLRSLVGGAGRLDVRGHAPAASVNLANPLLQRLRAIAGVEVEPKQAWTPVAEFAARGLDAVNFGPGDPAFAHRRDEQVATEALEGSLATLRRFLCA
ncbi:MAG: succinyl-diaminopimelate desuccinylase [Candidatus Dormibacteraeota bacterium]|nr:succinyl-diaminopimelate desuccinylase [Candidatus Dormibacteraeota bacterium]